MIRATLLIIKYKLLSWFSRKLSWIKRFWKVKKGQPTQEELNEERVLAFKPSYSDRYDHLFLPLSSSSKILVNSFIWDPICKRVNNRYNLPDSETLNLLKGMNGDQYNQLFSKINHTPDLFVDYNLWTKILKQIPENYQIPYKELLKAFETMSSDHYNQLFKNPLDTPQVFVDDTWKSIESVLPPTFSLPSPQTIGILKQMNSDNLNSVFLTPNDTPSVFIQHEIWNPIINGFSKEYRIPDEREVEILDRFDGRHYKHLFLEPSSGNDLVTVDHSVWDVIEKELPENYTLPVPLNEKF